MMESFSSSISLPFFPHVLPDEILGSWLGRLAAYNGLKSKSALLRWLGVPKRLRRISLADIVPPTESVTYIFSTLGLDYFEAISRLSTRPYWESVHTWTTLVGQSDEMQTMKPALLSTRSGRAIADKHLSQAFFKICPVCLEEDLYTSGASYFHRSHQLKGSRVCHKHGVYLLSNCPTCSVPLGDTRDLLKTSHTCRCGASLTDAPLNVGSNDPWWRLANFEHCCLATGRCALSDPKLIGFLRQQLKATFPYAGRFRGSRSIVETFGKDGADWIQRSFRGQITSIRPKTPFSLSTASASTYAALFVACGISFDEACVRVANHEEELGPQSRSTWSRNALPTTVLEARRQFSEFFAHGRAKQWKALRSERPHVFWLLIFYDLAWIESEMPPRSRDPRAATPDTISDRVLLQGAADLAIAGKAGVKLRHAAIRAFYRDRAWLDSEIAVLRERRKSTTRETLICQLKQVRAEHIGRTQRPKKFNRRDAARGLGTTVKTLLSRAAKFDVPLHLLEEDMPTFHRRALTWAVEQRLSQGLSLAPSMVRGLSGVGARISSTGVAQLIEEVVKELQSKRALKAT